MSTKIYDGYKLPLMSLKELMEFNKDLREKIIQTTEVSAKKMYADNIARMYDLACLGEWDGDPEKEDRGEMYSPFYEGFFKVFNATSDSNDIRTKKTIYDFSFRICYFPMDEKILAIIFYSRKEFAQVWESMPGVSEYMYFDNTDKPDYMTDEEWEVRNSEWDRCLGNTGIPTLESLQFFIPSQVPIVRYEDLKDIFPSFETRVETLRKSFLLRDYIQKKSKTEIESVPLSEVHNMIRKFYEWYSDENNKTKYQEVTDVFEKCMKKDIEKEAVNENFNNETVFPKESMLVKPLRRVVYD